MSKTKVFLAIPTMGSVVDSQEYIIRDLKDTYGEKIEFVYPKMCVRRMFHDFARNMLVEEFLDSGADILWFLDSDITPNAHVLDLILLHGDKWEVAGATYPVCMKPTVEGGMELVFTCYKKNPETGNLAVAGVPLSGTGFVDGLATGCLFIKREVFAKLQKPYFEHKYREESREMKEGEDLGFCRKLNDIGIQVFTDYSMVCKHQKEVCLLDMNNYAITYSNRNVQATLDYARSETQQAVQEAFRAGYEAALKMIQEKARAAEGKGKLVTPPQTLWTP